MRVHARGLAFLAISTVTVALTTGYVVVEGGSRNARFDAPPSVPGTAVAAVDDGPRLVFRHTGIDDHYGQVAVVALDDPGGPRAFTGVACDRVYATPTDVSCLRAERGLLPRFDQVLLDDDWSVTGTVALRGIPSRTRLSPDGSLAASTSFVSGHSYVQSGFSTVTEIRSVDDPAGGDRGNLETFRLVVDGRTVDARDRNVWGVTFVDDRTFYATAATGGHVYLVRGDLADRTLTTLRDNAACPSLSPDGRRIAYKVADGEDGPAVTWTIGVLDLASGTQHLLEGEHASVDDQIEWWDDETVLYGLPRTGEPGVTDVWSLGLADGSVPELLVTEAWSPAVVRP